MEGSNRPTSKTYNEFISKCLMWQNERHFAKLDRILYVNLAKNKLGHQVMESWLSSRQPIPYHRVNAMSSTVEADACAFNKTKEVCQGVVGCDRTLVHTLETMLDLQRGNTMILEDDMLPSDTTLDRLVQAINRLLLPIGN